MVRSWRSGLTTGAIVSLTATASALLLGCSPEPRSRFVVSPPRPRHRRGSVFSKVSSPSDQEGGWGGDLSQRGKTTQMRLVGESLERRAYIYEARLASPLGIKLAEQNSASTIERDYDDDASDSARPASRVVVAGVEKGSTAWDAGVRAGDCIVATGASWGGGMHLTSTVDGVTAAVTSRVKMFGDVNLRFERPFDSADEVSWRSVVAETFIVELAKPLGIELTEKGEGAERAVYVKTLDPAGNAALSGQVKVEDRIVAVSASIGNGLWDANSVEGVVSAVATRQLNQPIRFKLERQVSVGAWRELDGRDGSDDAFDDAFEDEENNEEERIADANDATGDAKRREDAAEAVEKGADDNKDSDGAVSIPREKKRDVLGMESAGAALDSLKGTDVSTASTQAVLFERSCALLHKYGNAGSSSSSFTGRTSSNEEVRAALANVHAVLDVVLAAPVVPPPKLMNMGMIAFLKLRRPLEAVTFFDQCLERGSLPNVLVATTLAKVLSKKNTFDTTAATYKAATANEVPQLKAKRGSSPALPSPVPQLAAVLESLEKQRLPLDSQFLNQLMQCYLIRGHLREVSKEYWSKFWDQSSVKKRGD